MGHLPSELLHIIFIQLPLGQRVKCLLVCRHWFDVLDRRSLLYDVKIDSRDRLTCFFETIKNCPRRVLQVEICIITAIFSTAFDKRIFLTCLPNLRVFKYKNLTFCYLNDEAPIENIFSQPYDHLIPDTRLEQVKDVGMCEFTRQLTLTGTCTRLERLNLTLSAQLENPRRDLFPNLKDMPVLKKLTIRRARFGIQDCELLHSNLPSLERFLLKDVTLNSGPLPRNIIPATRVILFNVQFDNEPNLVDYPNWYIYMARKYTKLTRFICDDYFLREAVPHEIMTIYRDGLLPLYRNTGKNLHHCDAKRVPTELEIFKQLDDIGCRLSSCKLEHNDTEPIFAQLAQSNQAKYVKQLGIECTEITRPSLLGNLTSLVSINIDMNGEEANWPINLTEYLNAFPPTLVDFSVYCTDVEISEIPTHSNNIQKLLIACDNLSNKLCQVISTCFPKLNDVRLKGFVTQNMTIDIPNVNLQCLMLDAVYRDRPTGFILNSTSDSQVKYYLGLKRQDRENFETVRPATEEELQDRITIRTICGSTEYYSFSVNDLDDWDDF